MYAAVLILLFFLTATATTLLRNGSTSLKIPSQPTQTIAPNESEVPIADFNAPEPADTSERIKRETRGRRHNLRDKSLTPEDKAGLILREDDKSPPAAVTANKNRNSTRQPELKGKKSEYAPPVIAAAVTEHSPPEQALPTRTSDLIIIGEVKDAKAFLSEDKTAVYSEFTIRVGEVLKSSSSWSAKPGAQVTALRPGGGVRFPSGKVRKFLIDGRTLPRAGARYAFFLKYDDLAEAFYIVTGYELRNGKVFPLDGIPKYGTDKHPFAPYSKYINVDEAAFLADLRADIRKSC